MALLKKNPTSAGVRHAVADNYADITSQTPEKSLLKRMYKTGGRGGGGRVSVEGRGGGSRRFYRLIDFKRDKDNIPARVATIEYDPVRNARIALLFYRDGEKRYILAPLGIKVDDVLMSGAQSEIRSGNAMPLKNIPVGSVVHNVELNPGRGGQLGRSAGAAIYLVAKEEKNKYAILRMPSGEQRKVLIDCRATIGQVGNIEEINKVLGKAGESRHRGLRPKVRGVAMNPCDHTHGGGEGKTGTGGAPSNRWRTQVLGQLTRKPKRRSNNLIMIPRKRRNG